MRPTWTTEQDRVLLDDAAARRPRSETAAALGVTASAVRSRLRKLRREVGAPYPLSLDEVDALWRRRVKRLDAKFRSLLARERQECGPSQTPGTDDPRPMSPVYVPVGGSSAGWCA